MRKPLLLFGAIVLVAVGGCLWVGYQRFGGNGGGRVLGTIETSPAFWNDGLLFLAGTNEKQALTILASDQSARVAPLQQELSVQKAAVSLDGACLLVVAKEGTQEVFWRYQENKPPEAIQSLRGHVQDLRFATNRFALVRERRVGAAADQLMLFDTELGTLVQVAPDAVSAVWLDTPAGILSVDSRGQMWFHGLQLSGRTDPPQLVAETRSNVVVAKNTTIYFVSNDEQGSALKSMDVSTKEQRLITPFDSLPDGRAAAIGPSPDGTKLAVVLPTSPDQENGSLVVVDLLSGAKEALPAIGTDVRWLSTDALYYERMNAGAPQVWRYTLDTKTSASIFPDSVSSFSS